MQKNGRIALFYVKVCVEELLEQRGADGKIIFLMRATLVQPVASAVDRLLNSILLSGSLRESCLSLSMVFKQ